MTMRIVTWNARMAFARKQAELARLKPDIAVIPECGSLIDAPAGCSAWVGTFPTKGLAAISYGDYRLAPHDVSRTTIRLAVPVAVTGPQSFFLLGIWAQRPYLAQVRSALETYERELTSGPAVVAGDFNQYTKWDPVAGDYTYSPTVELLRKMGLVSAYHRYHRVDHGAERHSTHYWRDRAKTDVNFHIDFCFVPKRWRLERVQVGTHKRWIASGLSDHVPLIVDVAPN